MFAAPVLNIKPTQKTKIANRNPVTFRCPTETKTLSPASIKTAKSAGYLCLLLRICTWARFFSQSLWEGEIKNALPSDLHQRFFWIALYVVPSAVRLRATCRRTQARISLTSVGELHEMLWNAPQIPILRRPICLE